MSWGEGKTDCGTVEFEAQLDDGARASVEVLCRVLMLATKPTGRDCAVALSGEADVTRAAAGVNGVEDEEVLVVACGFRCFRWELSKVLVVRR